MNKNMDKSHKRSVSDYLYDLGSDAPIPGGGSAAGLQLAMGCSLALKCLSLTVGKPKFAQYDTELRDAIEELSDIRELGYNIMDEDQEAYSKLTRAYALPQDADSEKELRKKEIDKALSEAAIPPSKLMEFAIIALRILEELEGKTNPMLKSDLLMGVDCIYLALRSGYQNMIINGKYIKDESLSKDILTHAAKYLRTGAEIFSIWKEDCKLER